MRLLTRDQTGELSLTKDLFGEIPPYAILSHRWSENIAEEVTFKDIENDAGRSKSAYRKIEFCAEQARRDGLQYFWVDTCCIDKSTMDEVQASINSMFRWYRDAAQCYVYLSDVSMTAGLTQNGSQADSDQAELSLEAVLRGSIWFTRGWTLQELLAPASVQFFSREGLRLGDKVSLEQEIHTITKIPIPALRKTTPFDQFDVDERLRWAEMRQTTREEDWAYCLLGIFGVFMPLNYGEGRDNAIQRLRKEIENTPKRQASFSTQILEKFQDKGATLLTSFGDLWDILISATTGHRKWEVVCILDALDECEPSGRNQLIDALSEFSSRTTTHAPAPKFLLTSRPYVDIKRRFRHLECDLPTIHLKGENEEEIAKISHEIDMVIKSRVMDISRTLELGLEEQNVLVKELTLVQSRTYLWVHLVFDEIQNGILLTPGKIRSEVRNIPRTVSEAYNRILSKSRDISLAKRLLHIVVAAARPLTLLEMALALAIGPKHQSIGDIDLVPEEQFRDDIRQLCGLFVVIVDSKVYLLHQTAREFLVPPPSGSSPLGSSTTLQWKFSLHPKESHHVLAEICILRLSLSDFNLSGLRASADQHQYIAKRTFLQYAAQFWADHFREANWNGEDWAVERAISYCRPDLPTSAWFEIYQSVTTRNVPGNFTPLLVASHFGLSSIIERLPRKVLKDVNVKDSRYGRSSISWAAGEGYGAVLQWLLRGGTVRRLLGTGARINSKDEIGKTPLHWASENGHDTVVKQLLQGGADANAKDKAGWTPLHLASRNGRDTVVKQLLEGGADANAKHNYGKTPLHMASRNGHDTVVKQLLKGYADANAKEDDGETPLYLASWNGHDTVVKQLFEGGADANAKNNYDSTPLYIASVHGHDTVVKQLFKGGADVNAKDKDGSMPLYGASVHGYDTVVKQLLEGGADANAKNNYGKTPLYMASLNGHDTVVKQLLKGGADANAKHDYGKTPLHMASRNGHDTVVKQLLKGGANANMKDDKGWTPLNMASAYGHDTVVNQLLKCGAENN
ncbi:hypothetical protein DL767_009749 [Monosporascus sp. MG133]|nr:hypothetical protein DL767_009749 [Monosporascus sp. MG133]